MRVGGMQMRRAGRAGMIAASLLAGTAQGQDNVQAPPVQTSPALNTFSLPPGNSLATPTPAPSPTPTPVQPPAVVPTLPTPTETPTTTPTPRPDAQRSRLQPVPSPAATPTTVAPTAAPIPAPTPTPATPVTTIAPPPATAAAPPPWLWWLVGFAVLAGLAVFAWRRFGRVPAETIAYVSEAAAPEPLPASAPTPGPPARPVSAAAPQPDRALVLDFRPQRLWTRGPDAFLAFELVVTNTGATPADAVRPVIVLASAGPDTVAEIAAFHANATHLPGSDPFDLRPGETRSVTGELTLPGDAMYVTSAADRELIVPIALISLQWRAGLSLARAADAFIIGTGDAAAAKLGPIWVDRAGLVYARLDARRFTPGGR